MSGDFSIWAFQATDAAVSQWLSIVTDLPSSLKAESRTSQRGYKVLQIILEGNGKSLELVNVYQPSQLWVLLARSIYAPVFHYLLRFAGARCIPYVERRPECRKRMAVFDVAARDIEEVEIPNDSFELRAVSPKRDLAIVTFPVCEPKDDPHTRVAYWAKTGADTYMVFAEMDSSLRQMDVVSSLPSRRHLCDLLACTEVPGDLKYEDVIRFR
jgi:hypothetical protein